MRMRGSRPSWDRLPGERERHRDHPCEAITVAAVASATSGTRNHSGAINVKGVLSPPRPARSKAPWRSSSAASAGQTNRDPGDADRPAAEVPHVGVQRLVPVHREHHAPSAMKRDQRVVGERSGRRNWVHCRQHGGVSAMLAVPRAASVPKPQALSSGPKKTPTGRCAKAWLTNRRSAPSANRAR